MTTSVTLPDTIGVQPWMTLPATRAVFRELLRRVYETGEAFVGRAMRLEVQLTPDAPRVERFVDFIYQPVRDAAHAVDGIFVLVTDVTDRARAENALRLSNWQLAEERARLAATVEAEQRAQAALRRFNETLEAHVKRGTPPPDR